MLDREKATHFTQHVNFIREKHAMIGSWQANHVSAEHTLLKSFLIYIDVSLELLLIVRIEGRPRREGDSFRRNGNGGPGVLRECLLDPEVESVLAIGRSNTGQRHAKLHEIVRQDIAGLSATTATTGTEGRLSGYDACFFCLGISAVGIDDQAYRRVTYDLTLSVAATLAKQSCDDVHLRVGRGHR
jgi:hypothetical protein